MIKRSKKGQFLKGVKRPDLIGQKYSLKHGMEGTRFYTIYRSMRTRCTNPKWPSYKFYGAKGVKLLWPTFENFKDDMLESYNIHVKEFGEKNTTIDRIDPSGNYYKKNCRWATYEQQNNENKRGIHLITFDGETLSVRQWERKLNFGFNVISVRLRHGWSEERALTTPVDMRYSHHK